MPNEPDMQVIAVYIVQHIEFPGWFELYTTLDVATERCNALNLAAWGGTQYETRTMTVNQQIPSPNPSTNFCRRPNEQ